MVIGYVICSTDIFSKVTYYAGIELSNDGRGIVMTSAHQPRIMKSVNEAMKELVMIGRVLIDMELAGDYESVEAFHRSVMDTAGIRPVSLGASL